MPSQHTDLNLVKRLRYIEYWRNRKADALAAVFPRILAGLRKVTPGMPASRPIE
jgi:hypothetical protein